MRTKLFLTVAALVDLTFLVNAQIKIISNGNVGIGVDNPVSKLSIGDVGNTYCKAYIYNSKTGENQKGLQILQALPSGSWAYGLHSSIAGGSSSTIMVGIVGSTYRGSTPTSSGHSIGVYGQAGNATNGANIGVHGEIVGTNYGTAVCGVIPNRSVPLMNAMYAGYFIGNVKIEDDLWVTALHYNSDINLKKDIRKMDSGNLDKIITLNAIKYKLKSPFEMEYLSKPGMDTISQATIQQEMSNPKYLQDRIGLSAQDIQKIYPELVTADYDGNLAVDYIGLIPVLVEAIKEQQVKIEELEEKVVKLSVSKTR